MDENNSYVTKVKQMIDFRRDANKELSNEELMAYLDKIRKKKQ